MVGEKGAGRGQEILDRSRLDTALLKQESLVGASDPLDRIVAKRVGTGGRIAAGCRVFASPELRFASGLEDLYGLAVEIVDCQVWRFGPLPPIPGEPEFLPGLEGRVGFSDELDSEFVG